MHGIRSGSATGPREKGMVSGRSCVWDVLVEGLGLRVFERRFRAAVWMDNIQS